MTIRRRARYQAIPQDIAPIVQLWLLRILVPLGAHAQLLISHGFSNDAVAELIGLGEWIDPSTCEFDPKQVRSELRKIHRDAERKYEKVVSPACLKGNVARLAELVGLSETDCRILEFTALIHSERILDDVADWLGQLSSVKVFHALSVLLDLPEPQVRAALGSQGLLARSGLVAVDRGGSSSLRGKLNLLSDNFADHICSQDADPIALLRDTVELASPGELAMADYGHVTRHLAILRPYLKHAVNTRRKGVNVFVHGAPGTGKSQLAKALAKELDCELFEVASEDGDGDPVTGERRLRAFRAAQSFFASRRVLILFDEVEDVFSQSDGMFASASVAQKRKAWINRTLEGNPVPTLWLANSMRGVDPAFIRRFDMLFELPIPPKTQRENIIRDACGELLDSDAISRIAESESLSPAVVTKAASVARAISGQMGQEGTANAVEQLINNTLEAQRHKAILRNDPNRLPDVYDPAFIHADADPTDIAAGLKAARSGRLCLFGPPGTGKTAYARWLAQELAMPLHVKRVSDLVSAYVGESEQNLARAFRQAQDQGALLMIDEVDSFLQDRRGARYSWEVTLVNEMLTQMESFPGIFIASTNLMDNLDQAALRRFDLKLKFGFLQPEQVVALFRRYCVSLGLPEPAQEQVMRVAALDRLTPGDFAAVARQGHLRRLATPAALIVALESECQLKEGGKAPMGFVQ